MYKFTCCWNCITFTSNDENQNPNCSEEKPSSNVAIQTDLKKSNNRESTPCSKKGKLTVTEEPPKSLLIRNLEEEFSKSPLSKEQSKSSFVDHPLRNDFKKKTIKERSNSSLVVYPLINNSPKIEESQLTLKTPTCLKNIIDDVTDSRNNYVNINI